MRLMTTRRSRVNRQIIASPAGRTAMLRDASRCTDAAHRDACTARTRSLHLLPSLVCGPPPSRGPIYFPESLPLSPLSFLSWRRSYADVHPAVLPVKFTGKTGRFTRAIRSRVYVRFRVSSVSNPSHRTSPRPRHTVVQFFLSSFATLTPPKEKLLRLCAQFRISSRGGSTSCSFRTRGLRGFYMGHVCHMRRVRGSICYFYRMGLDEQARR